MTGTFRAKVRDQSRFGIERSPQLLASGYEFWEERRSAEGSEVVRTRLFGRRATCVRGEAGARFFYESPALRRRGALPRPIVSSLFGSGGVQGLDGGPHRQRKQGFTRLLDASAARAVADHVAREWDATAPGWHGTVDLFDEVARMQLAGVSAWAGIDVDDVVARTADMVALVDGFGSLGARQVRAQLARRRSQRWLLPQVRNARTQESATPLGAIARWRDEQNTALPLPVATVEALNVVRPTVAVAWFAAAMASTLASSPQLRDELLSGVVAPHLIAQETRRHDPFAPFLGAMATEAVSFADHEIPRGSLVVLDLWGTDNDPTRWGDPRKFRPERFAGDDPGPYEMVPQGGGDREGGHRCPGEDVVLTCLSVLAPRIAERVIGVLDISSGMRRMPPEPHCKVVLGAAVAEPPTHERTD